MHFELLEACWHHRRDCPPRKRKLTKKAHERANLTAFVLGCEEKVTGGSDSDEFDMGDDLTTPSTVQEQHDPKTVPAEDIEEYTRATQLLRAKLSTSDLMWFDFLSVPELIEMQGENETVGSFEKLDDDEIVALVMNHNATGTTAGMEKECEPDEVVVRPELTCAQAEKMLNSLTVFFESVPDGWDVPSALQLSHAMKRVAEEVAMHREGQMRQQTVTSFFKSKYTEQSE